MISFSEKRKIKKDETSTCTSEHSLGAYCIKSWKDLAFNLKKSLRSPCPVSGFHLLPSRTKCFLLLHKYQTKTLHILSLPAFIKLIVWSWICLKIVWFAMVRIFCHRVGINILWHYMFYLSRFVSMKESCFIDFSDSHLTFCFDIYKCPHIGMNHSVAYWNCWNTQWNVNITFLSFLTRSSGMIVFSK